MKDPGRKDGETLPAPAFRKHPPTPGAGPWIPVKSTSGIQGDHRRTSTAANSKIVHYQALQKSSLSLFFFYIFGNFEVNLEGRILAQYT